MLAAAREFSVKFTMSLPSSNEVSSLLEGGGELFIFAFVLDWCGGNECEKCRR